MPAEIQPWENLDAKALVEYVNNLVTSDFPALLNLLYRLDVSEHKLKDMLAQHPSEDAGRIIAALIIERQQQKLQSRAAFRKNENDIPEEDRW
ncbi:hypothetical protein [Sediminibacterium ginsengisoli]|uniref:Uncharacterized protein n=1 Tax=Sediminibacterium ginsengisoli TaxID=413434 RepID=A0A1T4JPX5_9BACT|nr:hypothetical protein [Sediminibacterium ginsengisoli]SJZ32250.1 hypothetical protein SAMN04488132_10159 [Sediminibacterium ginsengisoli]